MCHYRLSKGFSNPLFLTAVTALALALTTSLSAAEPPAKNNPPQDSLIEIDAGSAEAIHSVEVRHQLLFNATPGMPGTLTGTLDDASENTRVRVLLEIDDSFLAVPAQLNPATKVFRAVFPSPKRSLLYQFQILPADGTAKLSRRYMSEPHCSLTDGAPGADARGFPSQPQLLKDTLTYQERSAVVSSLISKVKTLSTAGESAR